MCYWNDSGTVMVQQGGDMVSNVKYIGLVLWVARETLKYVVGTRVSVYIA